MYVQKVAQQGGWDKISEICVCMAHLFMAQRRKKRGGGHFYTTLKFFCEYLKYGFVFLRKKKNRFFLGLKIDKNNKKINQK